MNDSSKHGKPAIKRALIGVNTLTVPWNSSVSSIDSDTLICSENRDYPLVNLPGDPRLVLKIIRSFYVYFSHSHHVMYEFASCWSYSIMHLCAWTALHIFRTDTESSPIGRVWTPTRFVNSALSWTAPRKLRSSPKSPFLCVNWSLIHYGFLAGARLGHGLKEKVLWGIIGSAVGTQRKNTHKTHTHETKNELKWHYLLVIMPDS